MTLTTTAHRSLREMLQCSLRRRSVTYAANTDLRDMPQSVMNGRLPKQQSLKLIKASVSDYIKRSPNQPHRIEIGGGMILDASTRMKEHYFSRLDFQLREMDKKYKKAEGYKSNPLQAAFLFRGDAANGYKPFPADLSKANIKAHMQLCEKHNVVGVARLFDALNSPLNIKSSMQQASQHKAIVQPVYCYNTSDPNQLENLKKWVTDVLKQWSQIENKHQDAKLELGIKDMGGFLTPKVAEELMGNLMDSAKQKGFNGDFAIHTHDSLNTGISTYHAASKVAEDKGNVLWVCIGSPVWAAKTGSSAGQPIGLPLVSYGDLQSNQVVSAEYNRTLEEILSESDISPAPFIDAQIISDSQVPGGAVGNLISQLREAKLEFLLPDILSLIGKLKTELFGEMPLVTPTALHCTQQAQQIVIKTFTENKVDYKDILSDYMQKPVEEWLSIDDLTSAAKEILSGQYGAPPAPVNQKIKNNLLVSFAKKAYENLDSKHGKPGAWWPADLESALAKVLTVVASDYESRMPADGFYPLYHQFKSSQDQDNLNKVHDKIKQLCPEEHKTLKRFFSRETLPKVVQAGLPVLGHPASYMPPVLDEARSEAEQFIIQNDVFLPYISELDPLDLATLLLVQPGDQGASYEVTQKVKEYKHLGAVGAEAMLAKSGSMLSEHKSHDSITVTQQNAHHVSPDHEATSINVKQQNGANVPGKPHTSPMPATVKKILKKTGDSVREGDVIMMLEAMKMETEIKAECAGTIHDLNDQAGVQVAADSVLFVIQGEN